MASRYRAKLVVFYHHIYIYIYICSASACEHAKSFVCSVVLGDDIVPRLGVPLIYDIKLKVFQLLKNLDIPKVMENL